MRIYRALALAAAASLQFGCHAGKVVERPPDEMAEGAERRPDVLFIAIDDLNDWVGHLGGNPDVRTPNIDSLARMGVSFTNAHSPAVSCNPSRTAVLSGLRPSTTGVYSNRHAGLNQLTGVVSLTQFFKSQGYRVLGGGKIMHKAARGDQALQFDEHFAPGPPPGSREGTANGRPGLDWQPLAVDAHAMPAHRLVDWAIDKLNEETEQPLFLAVGIAASHPPWRAPEEYFASYPQAELALPAVPDDDLDDVPARAARLASVGHHHDWIVANGKWREAVQAYLAAISLVDDAIGRLLHGLERSPRAGQTVIVLWSDHGLHLGEKRHWHKTTLWEEATRIPLVFVVPGVTEPGGRSPRPVDALSIYPTLADVCGLPVPSNLDGPSLRALLENPLAEWDTPALTTMIRGEHAVRDEHWRYIRYLDGTEELYDHRADPMEWDNLAADPRYREVKQRLARSIPRPEASALQARRPRRTWAMELRGLSQAAPALFGWNARVRILVQELDSIDVLELEVRDESDADAPLHWNGRDWQPAEIAWRKRGRDGVGWVFSVDPEVEPGETRRYRARAYATPRAGGRRQLVAEREFVIDAEKPRVQVDVALDPAGGTIGVVGEIRDNQCVEEVQVLISARVEGRTRYWNGDRWQSANVRLTTSLERRKAKASSWRYPPFEAGAIEGRLRVTAYAMDCAGNGGIGFRVRQAR